MIGDKYKQGGKVPSLSHSLDQLKNMILLFKRYKNPFFPPHVCLFFIVASSSNAFLFFFLSNQLYEVIHLLIFCHAY